MGELPSHCPHCGLPIDGPELWGVRQAADHLGVSRQRIHVLAAENPELLPPVTPDGAPRQRRLWQADAWRQFALRSRPTGRPPAKEGTSSP